MLLGNTVVLVASFKYNAVELDEVSLTLLQNLAVADIMVGVLRGIPILVSGTYNVYNLYNLTIQIGMYYF